MPRSGRNREDPAGGGEPPEEEEPAPPTPGRRALQFLGRYDLVIALLIGVAVAVYLGLPDDEDPAPPVVPPPATEGTEDQAETEQGASARQDDREQEPQSPRATFVHTCGSCHTLEAADTRGFTGPNLDRVSPSTGQVLRFIRTGSLDGVMPPNLLRGEEAERVAEFVASSAGGG